MGDCRERAAQPGTRLRAQGRTQSPGRRFSGQGGTGGHELGISTLFPGQGDGRQAPTQPAWGPRPADKNKLPLDSVPIQNF